MCFNELISGVRVDLGIRLFGDDLDMFFVFVFDILIVILMIEGVDDVRFE